jgi:hypothetical protein
VKAAAQVLTPLTNHVAAVAPAAVIGVACGVLAIMFTVINLKVARLRIALLQVRPILCPTILLPIHKKAVARPLVRMGGTDLKSGSDFLPLVGCRAQ